MIRYGAMLVLGAVVLTIFGCKTSSVSAQTATAPTATATPTITGNGRISGTITSGTADAPVPDGLQVQLIAVDSTSIGAPVLAPVSGGKYAVDVPLAAWRVIIPRLVHAGVTYFGDPVTFADGAGAARTATRDFMIYSVTHEAPQLAIVSSTVTVVAIDREAAQIGLVREDRVANPSDRVYVGDDQGVTLRIPAPPGATEASGTNVDGTFAFARGVVTTTVPIRPGMLTSIVTRYVVGYDPRADQYALRVTTPLTAEQLEVRVPEGYVGAIEPASGARRAPDTFVKAQPGDPSADQVLRVVQSTGRVNPGGGIVVNLVGLSKAVVQTNPLTERRGALIAVALALAILGGGTAARWRWSRTA